MINFFEHVTYRWIFIFLFVFGCLYRNESIFLNYGKNDAIKNITIDIPVKFCERFLHFMYTEFFLNNFKIVKYQKNKDNKKFFLLKIEKYEENRKILSFIEEDNIFEYCVEIIFKSKFFLSDKDFCPIDIVVSKSFYCNVIDFFIQNKIGNDEFYRELYQKVTKKLMRKIFLLIK